MSIVKYSLNYRIKFLLLLLVLSVPTSTFSQSLNPIKIAVINDVSPKEVDFLADSIRSFYATFAHFGNDKILNKFYEQIESELILARPLLDSLELYKEDSDSSKTLIITNKKLSPVKMSDNLDTALELRYLVRGFSSKIGGRYAIISTFKLSLEAQNSDEFIQLFVKTVRHELGHLLGLPHCSDEDCVMKSGYDGELFKKMNYYLCDSCKHNLYNSNG